MPSSEKPSSGGAAKDQPENVQNKGSVKYHVTFPVGKSTTTEKIDLTDPKFVPLIISNYVAGGLLSYLVKGQFPDFKFDDEYVHGMVLAQLLQENINTSSYPGGEFINEKGARDILSHPGQGGPYQINYYAQRLPAAGPEPEREAKNKFGNRGLINYEVLQASLGYTVEDQDAVGKGKNQLSKTAPETLDGLYFAPLATAYFHYNDLCALDRVNQDDWGPEYATWGKCKASMAGGKFPYLDMILSVAYNAGMYAPMTMTMISLGAFPDESTVKALKALGNYGLDDAAFIKAMQLPEKVGDVVLKSLPESEAGTTYILYPRQVRYYVDQLHGNNANLDQYGLTSDNSVSFPVSDLGAAFSKSMATLAACGDDDRYGFIPEEASHAAFSSVLEILKIAPTRKLNFTDSDDRKAMYAILGASFQALEKNLKFSFRKATEQDHTLGEKYSKSAGGSTKNPSIFDPKGRASVNRGTIQYHVTFPVSERKTTEVVDLSDPKFTPLILSNYVAGGVLSHLVKKSFPDFTFDHDYVYGMLFAQLLQKSTNMANYPGGEFINEKAERDTLSKPGQGGPYQIFYAQRLPAAGAEGGNIGLINYEVLQASLGYTVEDQDATENGKNQQSKTAPDTLDGLCFGPLAAAYFHYNNLRAVERVNQDNWGPEHATWSKCKVSLDEGRFPYLDMILSVACDAGLYGPMTKTLISLGAFPDESPVKALGDYSLDDAAFIKAMQLPKEVDGVALESLPESEASAAHILYPRQVRYCVDQLHGNNANLDQYGLTSDNSVSFPVSDLGEAFSKSMATLAACGDDDRYGFIPEEASHAAFSAVLERLKIAPTRKLNFTDSDDRKAMYAILEGSLAHLEKDLGFDFGKSTEEDHENQFLKRQEKLQELGQDRENRAEQEQQRALKLQEGLEQLEQDHKNQFLKLQEQQQELEQDQKSQAEQIQQRVLKLQEQLQELKQNITVTQSWVALVGLAACVSTGIAAAVLLPAAVAAAGSLLAVAPGLLALAAIAIVGLVAFAGAGSVLVARRECPRLVFSNQTDVPRVAGGKSAGSQH